MRRVRWLWGTREGADTLLIITFDHLNLIMTARRRVWTQFWTLDIKIAGRDYDDWNFEGSFRLRRIFFYMRQAYGEACARKFAGVDVDA